MIKIKRGDIVLTVTAGAYKNYYRHLGYEPVGVAKSVENSDEVNSHPSEDSCPSEDPTQEGVGSTPDESTTGEEDTEDEPDEEPALSEIPLGEMRLSQLIAYAEELGLEYDGTPSQKELRKLIRDHLKEQ